jgi:tetratricopeptide (TPR) repeat protein
LRLDGQVDESFARGEKADALARQALAIDGEDPGALLVVATLVRNGWTRALATQPLTTEQRAQQAIGYVRRALVSDPSDPITLTWLGDYYRRFEWRWDDAEALFRRALAINPSLVDAHWSYSHLLATLGRSLEGLDHALTLFRLDPENLWRRITLPRLLYLVGLRTEALQRYQAEMDAAPANLFLLYEIYFLHVAEGDAAGLVAFATSLAALWKTRPQPPRVTALQRRAEAAAAAIRGQPAALLPMLDADLASFDVGARASATIDGRARDDLPFILSLEYAAAGRHGQAIDLLDRALEGRSLYWPASLPFGSAPFPKAMRADPRYAALWRRDPRLIDAVQRRRRALAQHQMAGYDSDTHLDRPVIAPPQKASIRAVAGTPVPRSSADHGRL